MCKEIEQNERRLYALIRKLKSFIEDEIAQELEKICPKPLLLTPFWSVKRYLEELRDYKHLSFQNGRYSIEIKSRRRVIARSCC